MSRVPDYFSLAVNRKDRRLTDEIGINHWFAAILGAGNPIGKITSVLPTFIT